MRRRLVLSMLLCLALAGWWAPAVHGATLRDATGREVAVPDQVARVLPAGPPAAVLLAALAPELMLGWPGSAPGEAARGWLPDGVASLPAVPRLTGREVVPAEQVRALRPDLILDYGDVGARYARLAEETQARLGVPTVLLDGALAATPRALRELGAVLHREARAEMLAQVAEAVLAAVPPPGARPPRVVYARGADGLLLAAPGAGVTEVFGVLGWPVLAPPGDGAFRRASLAQVAALDPDVVILQSEAAREALRAPEWQAVRAVRMGHAYVAPAQPFGWVEEPPSLNRLIGLAVLAEKGDGGATIGAALSAVLWGRAPTASQVAALRAALAPIQPSLPASAPAHP